MSFVVIVNPRPRLQLPDGIALEAILTAVENWEKRSAPIFCVRRKAAWPVGICPTNAGRGESRTSFEVRKMAWHLACSRNGHLTSALAEGKIFKKLASVACFRQCKILLLQRALLATTIDFVVLRQQKREL
ncbi:hypothetical protein [Noviherbaspirillum aerium]|uniref:hypothetical protein n=1 Tax=Noviherbaspirillum aerium TaxID=2588497 RepID=UPI00124D50C9|nr:hypothetical protein [Noviherbaspirillum aerium]